MASNCCGSFDDDLYFIYEGFSNDIVYDFYRLKLNCVGHDGMNLPPPVLRFHTSDFPYRNMALVAIGSKIYMIGGCRDLGTLSKDIVVVETKNIYTNDMNQIVRTIPNILHKGIMNRTAVAIGGMIYTFPCYLSGAPFSFEVFDPRTGKSTTLPEPKPEFFGSVTVNSYFVFKSNLIISTRHCKMYIFNTTNPGDGWKGIGIDMCSETNTHRINSLPFIQNVNLSTPAAVAVDDDGMFFALVRRCNLLPAAPILPAAPVIVQFGALGDHSILFGQWYDVMGLPEGLELEYLPVSHRSNIIYSYPSTNPPDTRQLVATIQGFCMAYNFEVGAYVAQQLFSFELKFGFGYVDFPHLAASFIIPFS